DRLRDFHAVARRAGPPRPRLSAPALPVACEKSTRRLFKSPVNCTTMAAARGRGVSDDKRDDRGFLGEQPLQPLSRPLPIGEEKPHYLGHRDRLRERFSTSG